MISAETQRFRPASTVQRRFDHDLMGHLIRIQRIGRTGILIHHARHQSLIQTAPVDPDTYRLVISAGALDHGGVLAVTFLPATHIPRVDAIFPQSLGAFGKICQ